MIATMIARLLESAPATNATENALGDPVVAASWAAWTRNRPSSPVGTDAV